MCCCILAILGYLCNIILWLVTWIFRVIGLLVGFICTGIAFAYSFEYVLIVHAVITYLGFIVTFALSKYWPGHTHLDSGNLSHLGCQSSVAPVPPPAIHHLGLFSNIWHAYHSAIIVTIICLAIMVFAFAEICLVLCWTSNRFLTIREALEPYGTLGQLKKSVIEISILRLIVLIGDVFCDPSQVDLAIFLTFVFAYLHFAAVFKLIDIGRDFGWLDGLVSLILAAFEHFVRPWSFMQLLGILLTTMVVCYKNSMWSGHGERLQPERDEEEGRGLIELVRQEGAGAGPEMFGAQT